MTWREEQIGRARPLGPTIYALLEWPTMRPRYVGKTIGWVGARHKAHLSEAKRGGHRPVLRWLREQMEAGRPAVVKHLEWLRPDDNVAARERYWVAVYRAEYPDLLNVTAGGEGPGAIHSGALSFDCEQCGSSFSRKLSAVEKGHNRFCSRACYKASLRGVSRPVSDACKVAGVEAAATARRARTHCKRGHPLSGDNLFRNSAGGRGCKECRKIHKATYRSKANG